MRQKYTKDEAEKIEELVKHAVSAYIKKEAKRYLSELDYIGTDVMGYSRNVFNELVSTAASASGAIQDKGRLVDITWQQFYKFQMNCVEK